MRAILKRLFLFIPLSLISPESCTSTHKQRMENPVEESVDERISNEKKSIEHVQELISKRISNILGFMNLYFLFQGMIFSSIILPSKEIKCQVKWIPFTLSLLVSIFNFFAVCENINMSLRFCKDLEIKRMKLDDLKRLKTAQRRGEAAVIEEAENRLDGNARWALEGGAPKIWRSKAISLLTVVLLFVFTGIMLCGCFQIKCVITAVVT